MQFGEPGEREPFLGPVLPALAAPGAVGRPVSGHLQPREVRQHRFRTSYSPEGSASASACSLVIVSASASGGSLVRGSAAGSGGSLVSGASAAALSALKMWAGTATEASLSRTTADGGCGFPSQPYPVGATADV